ncbi:hypothetical protein EX30DRAFT_342086 [Ascodesmis nigricans]|uniref:Uncharacterized protein n=1 Tax=Ascodesmis nigricans TaxID=341454 RepID=A0A4S2MTC0_9PEZI|nr:hypothetical protein EX30DRAFT_342086 [Ascodesmis nigricans]
MHFLPLNQNALVHPQGIPSRVCDCCYKAYRRSRAAKRSGSISSASTDSTLSGTTGTGIGMLTPKQQRPAVDQGVMAKVGSYVGSVPRDWSWSTF